MSGVGGREGYARGLDRLEGTVSTMFSSTRLRGAFAWLVCRRHRPDRSRHHRHDAGVRRTSGSPTRCSGSTTAPTPRLLRADPRGVRRASGTSASPGTRWRRARAATTGRGSTSSSPPPRPRHAEVTMVVALIPSFYSSLPTKPPEAGPPTRPSSRLQELRPGPDGPLPELQRSPRDRGVPGLERGATSEPSGAVDRPAGRAHQRMYDVRNAGRPQGAKVIAPPMVTRLPYQLDNMAAKFYAAARRRQAGLALLRRGRPEPLPAREVRSAHRGARGHDQASSACVKKRLRRVGVRAIEADLEHRGQLRAPERHRGWPPGRHDLRGPTGRPTSSAPTCSAPPTASSGSSGTATTGARWRAAARSATPSSPIPTTPAVDGRPGMPTCGSSSWMHGTLLGARGTALPCQTTGTAPTPAWSRTPPAPAGSTGTRSARRR